MFLAKFFNISLWFPPHINSCVGDIFFYLSNSNCFETGFEAVTIGQIEKYITDTAINMGWKPKRYVEKFGKKHVSIIGAGPAGLACAENLIRRGVKCTVYDKNPEIGGRLFQGFCRKQYTLPLS